MTRVLAVTGIILVTPVLGLFAYVRWDVWRWRRQSQDERVRVNIERGRR